MKTMNMPSFTAENSIYKTRGRYCMATACDSQNASANVQPASRVDCRVFVHLAGAALERDDLDWFDFWLSAFDGCWDTATSD
jgi:hypothetical protein